MFPAKYSFLMLLLALFAIFLVYNEYRWNKRVVESLRTDYVDLVSDQTSFTTSNEVLPQRQESFCKENVRRRLVVIQTHHYHYFIDWLDPLWNILCLTFECVRIAVPDASLIQNLSSIDVLVYIQSVTMNITTKARKYIVSTEDALLRGSPLLPWISSGYILIDFSTGSIQQYWARKCGNASKIFWLPFLQAPEPPQRASSSNNWICHVGTVNTPRRVAVWANLTLSLNNTDERDSLHVIGGFGMNRDEMIQNCGLVVNIKSYEKARSLSRTRTDLVWNWGIEMISENGYIEDEKEYQNTVEFVNYYNIADAVIKRRSRKLSRKELIQLFARRQAVYENRMKHFQTLVSEFLRPY